MLNNISQFFTARQLRIPVIGLLFTVGVLGEQIKPALSNQVSQVPVSTTELTNHHQYSFRNLARVADSNLGNNYQQITHQKAGKENPIDGKFNFPKEDGTYLYGQSPEPNKIGQGYIIFHKQQGKLVGALYMPSSEFSCFKGKLEPSGELAMTVTGTPETESAEVATSGNLPRLDEGETASYAYSVALQDYHQINNITAGDRQILQMCSQ